MTYVRDFLKIFDGSPLHVIYYGPDDDDVIWEGSISDTPWWVAEMAFDIEGTKADGEYPISYRPSLGQEYHNAPGIVICVV